MNTHKKNSPLYWSAACFRTLAVAAAAYLIPCLGLSAGDPKGPFFDPRQFGAEAGDESLDTKAIQSAIDACEKAGGGTVCLQGGTFLSGTLVFKDNAGLKIEAGSVLRGSTELDDYPSKVPEFASYTDNYTERSLLYAEKASRIAITGRGVIDGSGGAFEGPYKVRPYMLRFIECKHVLIRDITFRDSPMWVQHYLACDNVQIRGITVRSRVNHNNDGIDIDGCTNVRISDCDISSGDDAIVLKSTSPRPCRQVAITNCLLSSNCNAFKCGTESTGGFQDITLSNLVIYDTRLAGIALELVDGGKFERVSISNVTMRNAKGGIFIRLGNRGRSYLTESRRKALKRAELPEPGVGIMRDITLSDIRATGVGPIGCSITGLPGYPVKHVTLRNIVLEFRGGGKAADARRKVPELPARYPEFLMFGTLPAYGFYCRHLRDIAFHSVTLRVKKKDARPAVVCEDVKGLDVTGLRPASAEVYFRDSDSER